MYCFLTMGSRTTGRFVYVAMELALFRGLIALGLHAYSRYDDRCATLAAMLRVFVGFRMLYEIWVRLGSAQNGLPGFAPPGGPKQVLQDHRREPLGLFANQVDNLVLPALWFWVELFGAIQFAVARPPDVLGPQEGFHPSHVDNPVGITLSRVRRSTRGPERDLGRSRPLRSP
jgi:hypothetical protein